MTRHEEEIVDWIFGALIIIALLLCLSCDVARHVDIPPSASPEIAQIAVHNIHAAAGVRCQCCHGDGCPTGKDPRRCSGCHT